MEIFAIFAAAIAFLSAWIAILLLPLLLCAWGACYLAFSSMPPAGQNSGTRIFAVVCATLGSGFYLLPWTLAHARCSQSTTGIFWLNMLFGWTVVGWFAALIWAFMSQAKA